MHKKGLAYKLLSFFSLLNLSLQPFFNFLLISAPAFVLAQEQIEAGITFDKGKNSFNLTVNKPGEIHYELFYRTDSQIENVSGTSKNDGGNFSQEIYAGTCSSGGACTPHQVLRGILKIEVKSEGWLTSQKFTIDNGKLNLVEESAASDLNLTDEENSWLENPEQKQIEKECLTNQPLIDTKDEDWQIDKEKETAETKEKVKLGVKYVFPLEDKVSVSFKCLPKEGATPLKIQKVKISALNLPEGINPYGEYAYDITTGMQDGTFEYEITLPKPENATAEVSYIEKSVEDATKNEIKTDEVKAVEEEKLAQEGDKVKAEGLDHFTIFVVTKTSPTPSEQACIDLGGTSGSNCFNTIQEAINAASAGDTIKIAPGTYKENITIDKRLEIVGSGSGNTANDTIITSGTASTPVVTITASETSDTQRLVLKDLRVDGNGTGADGIKISSVGSYITFKNVYSVGNDGRGVAADWSGTATGIKILNCSFSNNQGVGFRTGSTSQISGIEIKDTHMDENLNGLYLNAPTTGLTIDGGSFDKNTSSDTNGVGIYALQFNRFSDSGQKPIVLKNFTANENQRGVILHTYGPFSIEGATVSKNSEEGITFSTSGGEVQVSGESITKPIVIKNVKVEDNPKSNLWVISYLNWTLSNVTIEGSTFGSSTGSGGDYGVYLYAAAGATLSNVSVKDCTIENNNTGIYLRAGDSNASLTNVALEENSINKNGTGILITDNAAGGNHAKFNNIVGNKDFGLANNDPDTPFDAELNWWNSNLGPTTGTVTGGDKVSGNVNFQEWLCEPYETNWYSEKGICTSEPPEGKKVTLCHAAGQEGTLHYNTLIVSYHAAYGNGGHFYENGTPRAGHEHDYLGACKAEHLCGNNELDSGEECDGTDGVGENQFCTSNCKLVPIYDGGHSCPPGTARSQKPFWSGTISAIDTDGETFGLTPGGKYLFEASGTFIPTGASGYIADAGYTTINGVLSDQYGIHGNGNDYTAHALLANLGGGVGVVDWGNYNSDHIYTKYYEPTTSLVQFLISDRYDNWFDTSYNNQSGMNDNSGNLSLEVYECQPASEVTICKEDDKNRPQEGWEVVLASEKVDGPTPIKVSDGSGTNSTNLPAGKYLIKVSGTYRYGSSSMNADAGFSYRPVSIPSGCDCWLNGFDLASKGLMARINGNPVNWGSYNSGHTYTYVYNHLSSGPVKISIWDDYYGDNVNDNDFQFEIYKIPEGHYGTTEDKGCATLENIPYGDYILDEALKDGWINLSGKGSSVSIDSSKESFTLANKLNAPVTIVATKIVCDNETDLPNWGTGGANITADTAQQFLSTHPNCRTEQGWNFQWGDDADVNSSDSYVGEVAGWNTFGPTNSDGLATVNISDYGSTSQIKVREVLKENYIPFTYLTNGSTNKDEVSAEIYCHTDVLNYDNDDRFTPEYGQTYYCVGFNAPKYGSISGIKYEDVNGNGTKDSGENGLSGWRIQLKQGETTIDTTTASDGTYSFQDVIAGDYQVCEVEQTGWKRTQPADSACQAVTVVAGQKITNIDFGNTQYGSVEVYKFEDLDGNGEKDGGEPLLPDWEILLGGQTATTSAQGKATFANLVAGEYNLSENLKNGWQQTRIYCTSDEVQTEPTPTPTTPPLVDRILGVNPVFAQIANNNSHQVSVNPGAVTTCYIGNFELGSISGTKIYDKDDDGVQDGDEKGIKGWKIYLSGGSLAEEVSTTTTDSDGNYKFTGLTAGVYTVREEKRDGWRASKPESGKSDPITISSGTNTQFNFFNAPPVSILLTKSNNAAAPVKPGDLVEYTLTITIGERTLSKMTLIDVLPDGFSYQTGTTSIATTLGGSTATVNSEPTLKRANKKLVWTWPAGIAGGSVVVVKYIVKINAANKPSSYTNFAYVWGSGSPTMVESQIVDSVVKIEPAYAPEGKVAGGEVLSAATQTTGQIEGQVLGAALPAAGANTWFLLAAIALIGTGLALRPRKKENRQKN